MADYTNPQTVTLRSDVYRNVVLGYSWLPTGAPLKGLAYLYMVSSSIASVDTRRTFDITNQGLVVSDQQVTTSITLDLSGPSDPYMPGELYYNPSEPNSESVTNSPGGSSTTPVPSTLTWTYTEAAWTAAGGVGLYPEAVPMLTFGPAVFEYWNGSAFIAVAKLIQNHLFVSVNEGGLLDPQTATVANTVSDTGGAGAYFLGGVDAFYGVADTTFGLILDTPNVPLGTLKCKSTMQGVFPLLPVLNVEPGAAGALFTSAAVNVASWGGWRYLSMKARVTGFSTTQPLPRILLGIVPVSKVNASVCAAALSGSPSSGIWYEVLVTEMGTTGQVATLDLAHPIAGSQFSHVVDWETTLSILGAYPETSPLGVGAGTVNIETPAPGATVDGLALETLSLVVTVNAGETVTTSGASINLSDFQFVETTGSVLTIDVDAYENLPIKPVNQPSGVDTNSPTNGTLLSIMRDGKPSVAVCVSAGPPLTSPRDSDSPIEDYPPIGEFFTWADLLAGLNDLGNGYQWTFEPLYDNFMTGSEVVGSFLPVPSKFPPTSFKLGATIEIPIAARCISYTSECPWVGVGVISGDDPVQEDRANFEILCLSDYIGPMIGIPMTVQSGRIGPGQVVALSSAAAPYGPPVMTSDYGPTVLTPDANGMIQISAGPPTWALDSVAVDEIPTGEAFSETVTISQYEASPQFDGFFITFDEGLARGESSASGALLSAYVPVRNGQQLPVLYAPGSGGATIAGTPVTGSYSPFLDRSAAATFCLRSQIGAATKYSEPRNALWRLSSDYRGRLQAFLAQGYSPYGLAVDRYPQRMGSSVYGRLPALAILHAEMMAVYRRLDGKFVSAITSDQFKTLGAETVLFNQAITGSVNVEYDEATSSQWYVGSLRSDGLSWLSAPAASTNPGALPQVAVLRRRDGQGNSLPFAKGSAAAISGTVWENVVFIDQPSGGSIGLQVLPTGIVVLTCGAFIFQSTDNGTTWIDQSGANVEALTTQTSGELVSGSEGGTANP
jgi:hypothetical protein